jgi:hypothetical protein
LFETFVCGDEGQCACGTGVERVVKHTII